MSWFKNNPSPSSGDKTGCLCWDTQTYSPDCCDGSFRAQGIGVIYRDRSTGIKLIEATLSNDERFSQSVFANVPISHIRLYNAGQDLLSAFNETTLKGSTLYFPYAITGKVYGFVLPRELETMETFTLIEDTLAGENSISNAAFTDKELKQIYIFNAGQHMVTAFNGVTLTGDTLSFPYPITGKVDGFVIG